MKVVARLSILLLFFSYFSFSQNLPRKKIVEIEPSISISPDYSKIYVTLVSTLSNGKRRATGSGKVNDISWKRFKVDVKNGWFSNGVLDVDKGQMKKESHEVSFTISPLNNPDYQKTIKISIPYLQKIVLSQKDNRSYLPYDQIEVDLKCVFDNGEVKDWTQLTLAEKSNLYLKANNLLMSPSECRMPIWSGTFQPYVEMKPVFFGNDSLGNSIFLEYETEKEIVVRRDGRNGRSGSDGRSAGSRTASNNRDGVDGESGGNGENGESAPDLDVYLDRFAYDTTLYVRAIVTDTYSGNQEEYYFKERFFSLKLFCNGGDGGKGGDGGAGSSGQDGADANSAGHGGNGGAGGYGGNGGNGGRVQIMVSRVNQDLAQKIVVYNRGGMPGASGSGGKKGRGGSAAKESKTSTIFYLLGSRGGSRGDSGSEGYSGRDGGETFVKIVE